MLELDEISLLGGSGETGTSLLHEISARFPHDQFTAILGSMPETHFALLTLIAGLAEPARGSLQWKGDSGPCHVGFIPDGKFTARYLTAREILSAALGLRVSGLKAAARRERAEKILLEVGLAGAADKQARFLSDEQICRLKIGVELVGDPKILLCERLATHLPPRGETEILKLLRQVCKERKCLTLLAPGNARHLEMYDSALVLHEGHLAYHGPGEFLLHYFNVKNLDELLPRLAHRKASEWHGSWAKHRDAYYSAQTDGYQAVKSSEEEPDDPEPGRRAEAHGAGLAQPIRPVADSRVSALAQAQILLARSWKMFFRNRALFLLQLSMIIGLPCLLTLLVWDGLKSLVEPWHYGADAAALAFQFAMCQAILLSVAGALNGAAEIAGERAIYEKEKFAGLNPLAYLASKLAFLAPIAAAQSMWMTFFVRNVCHFPGQFCPQAGFLFGVNAAVTALCLAISSFARSADRARLGALFLVLLQLPLSGAVLALPDLARQSLRLLDTAYWGTTGFLQNLGGFYADHFASCSLSWVALLGQTAIGVILAYFGITRCDWRKE